MRSNLFESTVQGWQNDIYAEVNTSDCGRCFSIPVPFVDVGLDTLKSLSAIEHLSMAAINLIGVLFCAKDCTLKDALITTERGLNAVVHLPVRVIMAPFKVAYQFFAIIIEPRTVDSTGKSLPCAYNIFESDTNKTIQGWQKKIYTWLNKRDAFTGRLASLPVALVDVALDILKPLAAIEDLAWAAINLIGALFCDENFALKHALLLTERGLSRVAQIPVKIVMAPYKVAFQFAAILIDPKKVTY